MNKLLSFAAVTALACITSLTGAAQTRGVTAEAYLAFEFLPDPHFCPDGPTDAAKSPSDVRHYKHLNYKFNGTGWFDNTRAHLWVIDAGSGAATQVTSGDDWNDSDPQWSPDGKKVAFVSDRSGKAFDESR